jgi:Protein of unknown function (DUF669)
MSTELPETFDTEHETGNSWELLPPGEYVAQIIETNVAPLKSNNGTGVTLVWQIIEGQYTNRLIWQNVVYIHTNETPQRIGRKMIKDLCVALGIDVAVKDASIWLHQPCRIRVVIQKDKEGRYDDQNRVGRISPFDGEAAEAQASTAAQSPQPRPVTPEPPRSATAASAARPTGSVPWRR